MGLDIEILNTLVILSANARTLTHQDLASYLERIHALLVDRNTLLLDVSAVEHIEPKALHLLGALADSLESKKVDFFLIVPDNNILPQHVLQDLGITPINREEASFIRTLRSRLISQRQIRHFFQEVSRATHSMFERVLKKPVYLSRPIARDDHFWDQLCEDRKLDITSTTRIHFENYPGDFWMGVSTETYEKLLDYCQKHKLIPRRNVEINCLQLLIDHLPDGSDLFRFSSPLPHHKSKGEDWGTDQSGPINGKDTSRLLVAHTPIGRAYFMARWENSVR